MAVMSEKLSLAHGVLHLAVRYLDHVMDHFNISSDSQLNLLALCCLSVAGILIFHIYCFSTNSKVQSLQNLYIIYNI